MGKLTKKEIEQQEIIAAHERMVKFFANLHNMHKDWPRRARRNKLLPSWITIKGKTKKLRNKYRRKWNTKTLVLSK